MASLTEKDLWEFVYRADDDEKIAVAERWLTDHKDLVKEIGGGEFWRDLMQALDDQYKLRHKPIETDEGLKILI